MQFIVIRSVCVCQLVGLSCVSGLRQMLLLIKVNGRWVIQGNGALSCFIIVCACTCVQDFSLTEAHTTIHIIPFECSSAWEKHCLLKRETNTKKIMENRLCDHDLHTSASFVPDRNIFIYIVLLRFSSLRPQFTATKKEEIFGKGAIISRLHIFCNLWSFSESWPHSEAPRCLILPKFRGFKEYHSKSTVKLTCSLFYQEA